jgi:predicted ferric reductase
MTPMRSDRLDGRIDPASSRPERQPEADTMPGVYAQLWQRVGGQHIAALRQSPPLPSARAGTGDAPPYAPPAAAQTPGLRPEAGSAPPRAPVTPARASAAAASAPAPGAGAARARALPLRARPVWRRPLLRLPRHILAIVLLALVAVGAAGTVWLWWRGTSHNGIGTAGDAFIAAGRITGLLGAYLLLILVTLMARIPWLERRIGSDWLARAHRWLGTYVVTMLVLHATLLIAGLTLLDHFPLQASADHVPIASETVMVVLTYPDVLMATVALALLVAIGALSARAVRQRLPYEAWHFTHLYAYLAIVLAFSHQIAVGADFRDRAARIGWSAAHALVLACVIRYRVGRPVLLALRHRLRVHSVVPQGDGVVSIYVTGRHLNRLGAQAGQFFRWRFLTRRTWSQAHPFSLSAAPRRDMLRLTVKAFGDHTRQLQNLRPGVPVIAEGPYGALTGLQRTRRRVLLLGGGIGVTPLRALLEALPGGPGDIALVLRGESARAMVFARELEALAAGRGAPLHYVLGRRPKCCSRHDPLSARRLQALVPDVAQRDVYICGSPGMMTTARRALREAGVPRWRIHAERFDF